MHGERVDGNDVLTVREAAGRLLTRAREESEPALLETTTYRFRGHSVADAGKVYRSAEEITSWRERDPITRYVDILREHDLLGDEELESMRKEVADEVNEAIREAAASPTPDPEELYENVYGDERTPEQFARMDTAAPFGERRETRSWRT
jgi:pyruvate dehydrogenase E1 component alpha subunit